jgi:CBS domain containing-hemolysin-like protein
VGAGEESGILEEEQRDMIDGILEMEETTTHEVMVPRPDIVAVEGDTPVNRAADVVNRYGFSRMPVYQDSIDTILGILYSKDLLRELREGRDDRQVKELVRPAYFVPESKRVSELLQELQRRKVHIALVVDEYGGIAGLVTIEDLLEEIVGEIQDEHDSEEPKEQITGQGEGIFDATVSVDDVNEALGLRLHAEEADTIGGLVYEKLGEIPVAGDTVAADGVLLTVLATTGRRIRRVKVLAQPSPEQIAGEGNVHLDVEVG